LNAVAAIVTDAELDVDADVDVDAGALDAVVDVLAFELGDELFEFELPHAATAKHAVIASAAVTALLLSKCTIGLLCRLV
jgi:hypothetical protein